MSNFWKCAQGAAAARAEICHLGHQFDFFNDQKRTTTSWKKNNDKVDILNLCLPFIQIVKILTCKIDILTCQVDILTCQVYILTYQVDIWHVKSTFWKSQHFDCQHFDC